MMADKTWRESRMRMGEASSWGGFLRPNPPHGVGVFIEPCYGLVRRHQERGEYLQFNCICDIVSGRSVVLRSAASVATTRIKIPAS